MEDDRRAADLRSMKRRATALLVVVAAVFLALAIWSPGDGGLDGLRARRRRGLVGRRAGRLVRGDGAVPPPPRPAHPAHGGDPGTQGPVRGHPRRVRAGELPQPGSGGRASAGLPTGGPTGRAGWPTRPTPPPWPARRWRGPSPPSSWPATTTSTACCTTRSSGRCVRCHSPRWPAAPSARPSSTAATARSSTGCSAARSRSSTNNESRFAPGSERRRRGGCPAPWRTACSTGSSTG